MLENLGIKARPGFTILELEVMVKVEIPNEINEKLEEGDTEEFNYLAERIMRGLSTVFQVHQCQIDAAGPHNTSFDDNPLGKAKCEIL